MLGRVAFTVMLLVGLVHAAPKSPPPPLPPGTVDLLAYETSEVAVSSTVANAKIPPEGLVDGDLETAWNSRTGDLAGAWIGFHVPSLAHVQGIRLTAGFTHADWFEMNPRIAKIRISQGGRVIVERALDVRDRGMQTILFDAVQSAGDFRIDVVDVVAGSKPSWREVSISELQVFGTVMYARQRTTATPVHVGRLAGAYGKPPPAIVAYVAPARPLLVVQRDRATLVVLDQWEFGAVLHGAPTVIDPGAPIATGSARGPVLLQPIDEPLAFGGHSWIGRALRLYGASGSICEGTIERLALVVDGKAPPKTAPPDARDVAAAWDDQREQDRTLVAVVHSDKSCTGALWARDAAAPAPTYGRIEATRLRTAMHARYFEADDDGYARLDESYQLNDLDAEYEDPTINEAKIPVSQRLTPELVDKTWRSFAACDSAAHCVGAAVGSYGIHEVARGYTFDGGTIIDAQSLLGTSIGLPLAAADVDGDGSIDLVYATKFGIGVLGHALNANAELYSPNW
jgi:hypothetical protein